MFGAAAVAASTAGKRRSESISRGKMERYQKINHIMKRYDHNHTGKLEKDQVQEMLQDLNEGVSPTEEELEFVITTSHCIREDPIPEDEKECISRDDLSLALAIWKGYKEDKGWIDEIFDRYDTDHSGALEEDQLRKLMTDLNEGHVPTDDEVSFVMKNADAKDGVLNGKVNRTELRSAVMIWYHVIEGKQKSCHCEVM
eukprot:Rmarinus@m.4303